MGLRQTLQHRFNAAHISCRLIDAGIPAFLAQPICRAWEWLVHPLLYWRGR